jgi:phospholipid/cholesterol/gamma-HCH transport system substrate-binding protein
METRASHLVVGLFVLLLSIGTAIFGVWLAQRDVDRTFAEYEIVFPGSVFGLQQGSQVVFRGVPVGRVTGIRIDPDDSEQVLVEIEVDQATPVAIDTYAVLVPQGVTGLLVVELRGGDRNAPPRTAERGGRPQIAGRVSAIEQVFASTPEILARAVVIMERVGTALSDENIERLTQTLASLEQIAATIAARTTEIDEILASGSGLATEAQAAVGGLVGLIGQAERLTATLESEVGGIGGKSQQVMGEIEGAARAARNLAWRADRLLATTEEPLQDFSDGGLYEMSEMIREIRVLVAAMSRIATDFERDPAGFLIGGSARGFTPQ